MSLVIVELMLHHRPATCVFTILCVQKLLESALRCGRLGRHQPILGCVEDFHTKDVLFYMNLGLIYAVHS